MIRALVALAFLTIPTSAIHAAELASYDSAGKLTSLIHDGAEIGVRAQLVVTFEGGVEVGMQPHDQRSPIVRNGIELAWTGKTSFPNGRAADFRVRWTEHDSKVAVDAALQHDGRLPLNVQTVDYVIDIPRETFVGGTIEPFPEKGAAKIRANPSYELTARKPSGQTIFDAMTTGMQVTDARRNRKLVLLFDQGRHVSVTDRWDADGRSYRVRVRLHSGAWLADEPIPFAMTFAIEGDATAPDAKLSIDASNERYAFAGFGANYCWGTENAVTDFTMKELELAWSRHELKAIPWDKERNAPGPMLVEDFKRIARIQKMGVPWIISVWRVPERFYTDPNQQPPRTFGRRIAPDRWDELLELFGSYLLHLKKHYGAEPELFSFNEPDLGVDIGFSPEAHREMVKRIGAYFGKIGLKTKMLLGDTANPRDTHRYVLPTAMDPEAMPYVGAVSFHSWNNGTPEQYAAWGDVADWLGVPLLIGEAGVDPGAYRNRNYDSYDYGLTELEQLQNLLRYARPQSSLYWQFTQDYGLARVDANGAVQPTGRFFLMKHFTNLTPLASVAIDSSSDREDVLVSAFKKEGEIVVHIANLGPARSATVEGLIQGHWRRVTTTEDKGWIEESLATPRSLALPARSLTTLVRDN